MIKDGRDCLDDKEEGTHQSGEEPEWNGMKINAEKLNSWQAMRMDFQPR